MATSAFRSISRRTPLGSSSSTDDPGYSSRCRSQRRARSLSRFPQRFPELDSFNEESQHSKGKFVNKVRGSQFLDISLDDLAIELFSEGKDMSLSGVTDIGQTTPVDDYKRRGRSVSRHGQNSSNAKTGVCDGSGGGKIGSDRRRRSVSAVRSQMFDNDCMIDKSYKIRQYRNDNSDRRNINKPSSEKFNVRVSQKSQSQRDLSTLPQSYCNRSSAQTGDESCNQLGNAGFERTFRAVHSETKQHPVGDEVNNGLYEVMRKELRHAVEDIRNELKQRECYRKDVPVEKLLEDEHELELCRIGEELNPLPDTMAVVKPSRARKRSNDRSRMSKRLTEVAEKYIEEFISSVEESDISSFDGDRSDGNSGLGPKGSPLVQCDRLDGVTLPWLLWETGNDSPLVSNKTPTNPILWPHSQGEVGGGSGRDSWSPNVGPTLTRESSPPVRAGYGSEESRCGQRVRRYVDDDEGVSSEKTETLVMEKLIQGQRVRSGGLLLCHHHCSFF